jgi:hypothetical protein
MQGRRAVFTRRRVFRFGIALATVATVAGCSSSKSTAAPTTSKPTTSTSTAASPGVDPSFQARATAICRTAGAALRAQGSFPFPDFDPERPDATDFPAIGQFEAKTVATLQTWQAQLHALGHPTTGSVAWNTFLAAVDRNVTSTVAQQQAAVRGDGATFTQTFHDLSSQGLAGTQAAAAIGAPNCDPDHLTG